DVLVEHGRLLHHSPARRVQHQVALPVQVHAAGAGEGEADGGRVGARGDHEVILQPALVAVVHEVDPRIDAPVGNAPVVFDAGVPAGRVVAEEVVAAGRQLVQAD